MALKFWLLLVLALPQFCFGQKIEDLAKARDYRRIVGIYSNSPEHTYTKRELILISYSLRKLGQPREDIKLNIKFVKRFYGKEHKKLLDEIRASKTIDPDDYKDSQKIIYWVLLNDYGDLLMKYERRSSAFDKDHKYFLTFAKILEGLEFREGKVDKLVNKVQGHIVDMQGKIYRFSWGLSFNYVSWQRDISLSRPGTKFDLNVTNRGYCIGGEGGYENSRYHFFADGCVLLGAGSVSNSSTGIKYQQSNVKATGFKGGPGASIIATSTGSRVGIKLPFIYTIQDFAEPSTGNLKLEELKPLSFMASLYTRFQFGRWYLQSEFGKYIQEDHIFWGLGAGKTF